MNAQNKNAFASFSITHLCVVTLLSVSLLNFLAVTAFRNPFFKTVSENSALSFILTFLLLSFLLLLAFVIKSRLTDASWGHSLLVLSPVILLFLWPGAEETSAHPVIALDTVILTCLIFFRILSQPHTPPQKPGVSAFPAIVITIYGAVFIFLVSQQMKALSLFNLRDWAVYNQSFWSSVHGHPFLNSLYGSNFSCHNTWFFYLLTPFYALFPHPMTLAVLRTLLLSLAAIPFYRISKDILKEPPPRTLVFSFLFCPFLVSQNLIAPHEMGYAPFFLLWTYYFYRKEKLGAFLFFLMITLSIKEHLSALAVAFGLLALLHKKSKAWVLIPMILGISWGIFSLNLLHHFQNTYPAQHSPSWVPVNFHGRFLSCHENIFSCSFHLFGASNLGQWNHFQTSLLPLLALGVWPPLLSSTALLALPEWLLNLLLDRSVVFSPIWHYNVTVSCFLLIASVYGLKEFAASKPARKLRLSVPQARRLGAGWILAAVIMNSYSWMGLAVFPQENLYAQIAREAVSKIPAASSVTAPARMALLVSQRENISLLGFGKPAEFVIVDGAALPEVLLKQLAAHYKEVFRKDPVRVYQKIS